MRNLNKKDRNTIIRGICLIVILIAAYLAFSITTWGLATTIGNVLGIIIGVIVYHLLTKLFHID